MVDLLIIMGCLFVNALLAGAEIAFVAVNKPYLRELVRQGHKRAQLLLHLRENPERTLSVVQIGITLVGALAGAVGGAGAEELLSPSFERLFGVADSTADTIAIGVVVLPLTYLTVVIGELVPKSLALRHAEKFALRAAPWLSLFDKLFGPIVTVFEWSTKQVLTLLAWFRIRKQPTPAPSQADLPGSSPNGEETTIMLDVLSAQHREYVMNVVSLERKTLRQIHLPWKHVVHVECRQEIGDIEHLVLSSGHTRIPVVKDNEVVGILNTKEFIALRGAGRDNWTSLIRTAIRFQSSMPLLPALRLLQERRMHMAIVYAERSLLGIVTMEDILEEIVGEIYDEDDDGMLRKVLSTSPRTVGMNRTGS